MSKDLIKQDLNFMEKPLWFQDEKQAELSTDGFSWKDSEGYLYKAGYKPPVKTDLIFLLYILLQSQREGWAPSIRTTRYKILSECGFDDSKHWYERLEDSLRRWKMIGIEFKGTFYDGKEYAAMNFGIVDSWKLDKKTNELKIVFSPLYLEKVKESGFFKYLDFDEVKALRSPLATRLYEIVAKMFQGRSRWEIDCQKLARKIPMSEKYPADIIPKIKAAVNRINDKTSLKLKLHIRKPDRGKAILTFEKLPGRDKGTEKPPVTAGLPESDEFRALIALLPEKKRNLKTVLEMLRKAYSKHGYHYAARNITYTNRNAREGYRAYLDKALKNDYGLADEEDRQQERLREREQQAALQAKIDRERQEKENRLKEEELLEQSMKLFNSLPEDEQEQIRNEAINNLDEGMQLHIRERRTFWNEMQKIAIHNVMVKTTPSNKPHQ